MRRFRTKFVQRLGKLIALTLRENVFGWGQFFVSLCVFGWPVQQFALHIVFIPHSQTYLRGGREGKEGIVPMCLSLDFTFCKKITNGA